MLWETKAFRKKQITTSYACFVALLLLSTPFLAPAQNFWQQTNGPTGGDVRALIVNDDDDLFAGTWGAGIFRSTDNGDSWAQVNDGLSDLYDTYVNDFATDSAGEVFAGTYNGVFFSENNGNSWNHIGLAGIAIFALAINANGDIFAGTNGFENNGIGLYRSSDHGQTWIPLTNGLGSGPHVLCLAISSTTEIFLGCNNGVYRSLDNGNNWMQIALGGYEVDDIIFNPDGDIFAGASNGVYLSDDNGTTWVRVLNTVVQTMAANSAGHLFAGTPGAGIYRSIDGGNSWITVNAGLYNKAVWVIAINSQDHPFAGTFEGGVFRSTDNGDHWIQTNRGLINSDVFSLAINSSNTLFAGTRRNGLFSSTDKGESWSQIGFQGLEVHSIAFNSFNHIFVGTLKQGVFRSTDGGSNWMQINNGLPPGVIDNWIYEILIKPQNNYIFLATVGGIYRSTDNGDSWIQAGFPYNKIFCLVHDSQGYIFRGSDYSIFPLYSGIYVSPDEGNNWSYLGLQFQPIYSLHINSQDHIFAGTEFGVYRSTDAGSTWTPVLNNAWTYSLASKSEDHIFAGTRGGGVYHSEDNGNSWTQLNSGLPYSFVFSLAIDADGYVFAGTDNGGVFRSINIITSIDNPESTIPSEFVLKQNYPNPFNPSTRIRYQVPLLGGRPGDSPVARERGGLITLKVYDILGTEIATLVNEKKTPGEYEIEFDASQLASGIYLYRLTAGSFNQTRKMILLK